MSALTITIIVIFVSSLLVGYFKSTLKDRCLKDLEKYRIIVALRNDKGIWGKLHLESTGFLLNYDKPNKNADHIETGYIMYRQEYSSITGFFRILDDLNDEEIRRRKYTTLAFKRGWIMKLRTAVRNFFAAVRDAIVDTYSLFLGKISPKSSVIASNQKYMKAMGQSFVDYVGNSYDPVLDKLIGKKVVYEFSNNGNWKEYVGVLKNYTKDFIEILDTSFPFTININIHQNKLEQLRVLFIKEDNKLTIANNRKYSVAVKIGDSTPVSIEPGQKLDLEIETLAESILVKLQEPIDAVFPRSDAMIRHLTI